MIDLKSDFNKSLSLKALNALSDGDLFTIVRVEDGVRKTQLCEVIRRTVTRGRNGGTKLVVRDATRKNGAELELAFTVSKLPEGIVLVRRTLDGFNSVTARKQAEAEAAAQVAQTESVEVQETEAAAPEAQAPTADVASPEASVASPEPLVIVDEPALETDSEQVSVAEALASLGDENLSTLPVASGE